MGVPVERINQSVLPILRVKYAFGLFQPTTVSDTTQVSSVEHQAVADDIARQAVTVVRSASGHIVLPSPPARLLLISPISLPSATSHDGTLFAEMLRDRGYKVTELVIDLDSSASRDKVRANATAQATMHNVVIFGEWKLIKRYVNSNDQWQEQLVSDLNKSGRPLIMVAWHNPAAILRCPKISAFVTAYGNTGAQVSAVVAVLTRKELPLGHLPITLLQGRPN